MLVQVESRMGGQRSTSEGIVGYNDVKMICRPSHMLPLPHSSYIMLQTPSSTLSVFSLLI